VSECDLETSKRRRRRPDLGCCATGKERKVKERKGKERTLCITVYIREEIHGCEICALNSTDSGQGSVAVFSNIALPN
jgi:hypothetical protein